MWPTYAGLKIGNMPIMNLHRAIGILFTVVFVSNILLSRVWLNLLVSRLKPVLRPVTIVSCFFIWRLLSAFASKDITYSAFLAIIDILLQFVIFIVVVVSFDELIDVKNGFKAVLFGSVLVVLLGTIEYFTERNIFVSLVPDSYKNIDFIASAIEEKVRDNYRVQVAFMHPLVLAEYLIMVIPISLSFLTEKRLLIRVCSIFVFCGSILVLLATGSRSGIVVLGAQIFSFCLYLIFCNGKYRLRLRSFVLSFLLITASIAITSIYGKTLILGKDSAETMSTIARLVQLLNGIYAVLKKPIWGYGQGFAPDYVGVENIATGRLTLDNYYLTLVVESGIPALVLFILILLTFYRCSRLNNNMHIYWNKYAANLISCSLIGFIIFCFILSTYEVFGIAYAILGFTLVLHRISIRNINSEIKGNQKVNAITKKTNYNNS